MNEIDVGEMEFTEENNLTESTAGNILSCDNQISYYMKFGQPFPNLLNLLLIRPGSTIMMLMNQIDWSGFSVFWPVTMRKGGPSYMQKPKTLRLQ